MKIIYLANARIPTEKAHGVQIMKMCEAFAAEGHAVELVLPRRFNQVADDPFAYYGVPRSFSIRKIGNVDLVSLGKIGFAIQAVTFSIRALFDVCGKKEAIVYSRDAVPLFFLSFFRMPFYWEAHVSHYNFMVRRVLRKAKGVIAISGGLRDLFVGKGADLGKFLLAPDSIDGNILLDPTDKRELRAKLGLPQDRTIVGYVGKYRTMGKEKGVGELIKVFGEIASHFPKAHLLLVGINPSEMAEVKDVLAENAVAPERFEIVGHVKQEQAMRYIKAADVLVMNYPDTPHYALYMSPLKLFEYMASGNPIVTTDLPSVREILDEKSAFFAPADDHRALREAIEKAILHPEEGAILARRALEEVKKYTWQKRAAAITSFISGR
ncbi:MAG: glycosyltransferase family 4 protein [Minisyncoccia bacterium]|jgi:glycosyltransferase involved in cell wall biosynthesis